MSTSSAGRRNGTRTPSPADVTASVKRLGTAIREELWSGLRSRQVRAACHSANEVTNVVVGARECDLQIPSVLAAADRDEDYRNAMVEVGSCADDVHRRIRALAEEHIDELVTDLPIFVDTLRRQVLVAHGVLRDIVAGAVDCRSDDGCPRDPHECVPLNEADVPRAREWLIDLDKGMVELAAADQRVDAARRASQRVAGEDRRAAELAAQEAANSAAVARAAAGDAASEALGRHFENFADRERRTANSLRWTAAVLLVVLSIAAAVMVLVWPADVVTTLARLAAGLPIAALATYLASESSRHRAAARWSAELGVKLRTLPAYTKRLGSEERVKYWTTLGETVFTGADGSRPTEPVPGAFDDLLAAAAKLGDLVAAFNGTSRPVDSRPEGPGRPAP